MMIVILFSSVKVHESTKKKPLKYSSSAVEITNPSSQTRKGGVLKGHTHSKRAENDAAVPCGSNLYHSLNWIVLTLDVVRVFKHFTSSLLSFIHFVTTLLPHPLLQQLIGILSGPSNQRNGRVRSTYVQQKCSYDEAKSCAFPDSVAVVFDVHANVAPLGLNPPAPEFSVSQIPENVVPLCLRLVLVRAQLLFRRHPSVSGCVGLLSGWLRSTNKNKEGNRLGGNAGKRK